MFSSDHEGERATAARMADRLLREHGLTWEDIITQPAALAAEPWREACEDILAAGCTAWERKFCRHLLDRWHGPLTEKQSTCLARIFELRAGCERRRA
jgi:hypothetical protein